jgi:hypothetical protein
MSLLCACTIRAQTTDDPNPNRTTGFAADAKGNSYISFAGQNKVYKLNPESELSVFAGTGEAGFNGDNVPAAEAQLNSPWGLYLDTSGNLYIADTGNARLRKVDAGTGAITTVAGNGTNGSEGDGDIATNAQLNTPASLTGDAAGNLVIADAKGARIRMVAADSGLIATVPLDEGLDPLSVPYGVAADADRAVFVSDSGNVYKLDGGKLKKASPETVSLASSGAFYAAALQQIAYPMVGSPVPLAAEVEWVPASCPPPGTNPRPAECFAAARLMVNLQRLPAKSTIEVKPFGVSDTIAAWTLEDVQFASLTGTGTVSLVNTALPIELSTVAGPKQLEIDVPLSAVRVKITVTGSVQINSDVYKFSLSGTLFP